MFGAAAAVVVAVVLLAAGCAKLATAGEFATTVQVFIPVPRRAAKVLAWFLAFWEAGLGASTLLRPGLVWLAFTVLAFCGGLLLVAILGLLRHRGRECNCFGGLSRGRFGGWGAGRALALFLAAALHTWYVNGSAGSPGLGDSAYSMALVPVVVLVGFAVMQAADTLTAIRTSGVLE
ncbi:MauE/DoxX family redox-associated membrane protein [Nonomuraea typhae]|uniref:MauE/DoxX family redox-associated membrane protein n=1 Tax=Nonomuraea typhae TaxID=2603600 RepID=UPI0031B58657